MSAATIHIRLRINFPTIFFLVLAIHMLMLVIKDPKFLDKFLTEHKREERTPLKIRNIRTVGAKDSKNKQSTYLAKTPEVAKEITKPEKFAQSKVDSRTNFAIPQPAQQPSPDRSAKHPLSLSDLSAGKSVPKVAKAPERQVRPGTRPELPQEKKAISAISLKGQQIRQFAETTSAAAISGDPRVKGLNNSDILVNLEVPEGVNPDELNKYELMFYGFQRRTAINYINSFFKNLDKFERENPHMTFPMTDTKQVMTGRLTYDEKGNLKQIKMIRWSNIDRLQDFFVDVLKDMDTLHNPPQALWEKDGEFSIFFSLVING